MTDITVTTTNFQVEKRGWLIVQPGASGHGYSPSVTLDVAKFTAGTHYPLGYIPSGTVLGKVTASGLYGPYDSSANDGRQTAVGFLFNSVTVNFGATKIGTAAVAAFAVVNALRLPFTSGAGALDTAARTALRTIFIEN